MIIKFNTLTRRFGLQAEQSASIMAGVSEELFHNLVRLMQRPNSDSVNHWLIESAGFVKRILTKISETKNRHIEYFFSPYAKYCNNPKYFFIAEESVLDFIYEVNKETMYGESRNLTKNQIGYGLFIFLGLINRRKVYSKSEVDDLFNKWFSIISRPFNEWSNLTNIAMKDVRIFPSSKNFSFILDIPSGLIE